MGDVAWALKRVLTLNHRFGHLLLTRPSQGHKATLVPPLTGEHSFGKIRKWISSSPVKMAFVPE